MLTVTHKPGDFLGDLVGVLPADNRSCLGRSVLFAQSPQLHQLVKFATETLQWRLIVYADGANQWQMYVEPVHGDLRVACASVWRSVRTAARRLSPKLTRLKIVDQVSRQELTTANVGLLPQARRREFWLALSVGACNAMILAITGADDATLRGTVPGFVAAGVALLVIAWDATRKSLVWHV